MIFFFVGFSSFLFLFFLLLFSFFFSPLPLLLLYPFVSTSPAAGGISDIRGPVHITIGDGGNREGLSNQWRSPNKISEYRNGVAFGYGKLRTNETHLVWEWYAILDEDDDDGVENGVENIKR